MADIELDIQPLVNAIDRLSEGLDRYAVHKKDTQLRDGLIQRFEFTYESSHKMLKRFLTVTSPNPDDFSQMNFQDLIRTGNQRGSFKRGLVRVETVSGNAE